jgi:LemA protein
MIWVIVAVVVVVALIALTYNGLVRRRNRTKEAWAQIDVQLKRRHDLIPNLVETVKGYAAHESQTFENVTKARAGAVSASQSGNPAQMAPAENILTQALRGLFAVAEAYPDLKAVDTFLRLQEELTATEDKIGFARQYYNTSVRDYNTAIQTVPRNIIASMFGFRPAEYFEAEDDARSVPKVEF